jgi:hypothetical protein
MKVAVESVFANAARLAEKLLLYEGLPHPIFEQRLFEEERTTKAITKLNGYPFYQQPLILALEHSKQLSEVLARTATYKSFSGEKRCGGFHPDFAVEWPNVKPLFQALICFGCREIKLWGPGIKSRNDLDAGAALKLQTTLLGYRRNRPAYPTIPPSQSPPPSPTQYSGDS